MTTRALVAFATKHGSTGEIAAQIGDAMREAQLEVDVRPAREVSDVEPYDVVVLGSGVYMNRWLGDAIDFARRFERQLRGRPIWFFSSGPTGGTPDSDAKVAELLRAQPEPPGNARGWASRLAIRGHATFGGRVDGGAAGMAGIFERWVPKGDWRDRAAIEAWARDVARDCALPFVRASSAMSGDVVR
jgi:menaquinone-dependent protoporphyrinogen oxidase